jgi:hypothetical protein
MYAKVWRVNNLSNYNAAASLWGDNLGGSSSNPVFAQLNDLMSSNLVSSNAGDTVHLEGATATYNNADIRKKLIIIGAGFFLDQNPNSSVNILTSKISFISFESITGSTSSGSKLIGVSVNGAGINLAVNNIEIIRCKINADIRFNVANISNFLINGNFFEGLDNTSAMSLGNTNLPFDIIITNNIFQKPLLLENGGGVVNVSVCNNNIFDCPAISGGPTIKLNASQFQNNILKTANASVNINNNSNQNVSFNVSSSNTNQFGTANDNIVVTNINSIFVDPVVNSSDGDYQLLTTWANANPGSDAAPRGAFGGASSTRRYTLSGLAPIPVIYDISTSGVAGPGGLQVTIKAKVIQ